MGQPSNTHPHGMGQHQQYMPFMAQGGQNGYQAGGAATSMYVAMMACPPCLRNSQRHAVCMELGGVGLTHSFCSLDCPGECVLVNLFLNLICFPIYFSWVQYFQSEGVFSSMGLANIL